MTLAGRSLYLALGGVFVLGVLIAAGIYLPKHGKAAATAENVQPEAPPTVAAPEPLPPEPAKPKKQIDYKALAELEHRLDQLQGRAMAVNASLDRINQQQLAAGYGGLRGDMAARQMSLRANLSRAHDGLVRQDVGKARRYADLATADVEVLEHFLGR